MVHGEAARPAGGLPDDAAAAAATQRDAPSGGRGKQAPTPPPPRSAASHSQLPSRARRPSSRRGMYCTPRRLPVAAPATRTARRCGPRRGWPWRGAGSPRRGGVAAGQCAGGRRTAPRPAARGGCLKRGDDAESAAATAGAPSARSTLAPILARAQVTMMNQRRHTSSWPIRDRHTTATGHCCSASLPRDESCATAAGADDVVNKECSQRDFQSKISHLAGKVRDL